MYNEIMKKAFILIILSIALPIYSYAATFTESERQEIGLAIVMIFSQVFSNDNLPKSLVADLVSGVEKISELIQKVDDKKLDSQVALYQMGLEVQDMMQSMEKSGITTALTDAREKGEDAAIKARLANLRAYAELYYDEDMKRGYKDFCKSDEVEENYDAIDQYDMDFECEDDVKSYKIYANTNQSGYVCVDSTGSFESDLSEEEVVEEEVCY